MIDATSVPILEPSAPWEEVLTCCPSLFYISRYMTDVNNANTPVGKAGQSLRWTTLTDLLFPAVVCSNVPPQLTFLSVGWFFTCVSSAENLFYCPSGLHHTLWLNPSKMWMPCEARRHWTSYAQSVVPPQHNRDILNPELSNMDSKSSTFTPLTCLEHLCKCLAIELLECSAAVYRTSRRE